MNDLGRTSQVSKTDFCGIANLVHNKVEEDIVENANNRLPCRLSSSAQDRRQQQRDCRRPRRGRAASFGAVVVPSPFWQNVSAVAPSIFK